MAVAGDQKQWRSVILCRLQQRNRVQTTAFAPLIQAHNKLFESADSYRKKNTTLTVEVERLKQEILELQIKGGGASNEAVSALEKKVFKLQEEVTELHRKKGENAQSIIDLNATLKDKEKEILIKEREIKDLHTKINVFEEHNHALEQKVAEERTTREVLADEQQALQLAFTSLEEKFRKMQEDNNDLVTRWMALKAEAADSMNTENDAMMRAKQKKLQQQLEEAAKEHKEITPPKDDGAGPSVCFVVTIPERAMCTFDAHDGEVNSVKWGPTGRIFSTGGSDRKLKLWEIVNGRCESKGILMGSNAAIMSVAFDQEESLVLAASNDFASRVWSIGDQRLRHTLTGHSGKVLAARFLGDSSKVVSGSYDRTVKVWDLRSKACIKTIFAGSSCNDVVTSDSQSVISGHFDRKIRFWDMRADSSANEIYLQGRVTSLDLSPDLTTLLSCSRDDTLKIIDLRMNTVIKTLSADGFHVGADWSRAVFSPDGHYVMCGSSDGSLFVWNVYKNRVEKVLRQHQNSVVACSWCPTGSGLISCDKQRSVVYWSDF